MENKRENIWLNLGFNIVAPSLLLIKGTKILDALGLAFQGSDAVIFVSALLFPLAYGAADLLKRRKLNLFSVLGLASVLLTGGIGLMKLSRGWMIVKEGALPLIIGAAVMLSARTKKPLARVLLLNDAVLNTAKLDLALQARGARAQFDNALKKATYALSAAFLLSSALNFALALHIFKSPAGTPEFNAEVGRMTALSFPVIVLPVTVIMVCVMFGLISAITKCTGLTLDDLAAKK